MLSNYDAFIRIYLVSDLSLAIEKGIPRLFVIKDHLYNKTVIKSDYQLLQEGRTEHGRHLTVLDFDFNIDRGTCKPSYNKQ